MPTSIGRTRLWKLESWATGAFGAFVAQVLIRALYRVVRKDKAPSAVFDTSSRRFSWPDALVWALAGGIGLGAAKMLSGRVAAVGWKLVTGTPPPGSDDQRADGS
jgi:hypothetical protein